MALNIYLGKYHTHLHHKIFSWKFSSKITGAGIKQKFGIDNERHGPLIGQSFSIRLDFSNAN
jgi:hypothetical protein